MYSYGASGLVRNKFTALIKLKKLTKRNLTQNSVAKLHAKLTAIDFYFFCESKSRATFFRSFPILYILLYLFIYIIL